MLVRGTLQRLPVPALRAGGLRDEPKDDEDKSAVIMAKAGTYGLAPGAKRPEGAIMRKQVADVCVEASVDRAAANTVVEIITSKTAEKLTTPELFKALQ